MFEFNLENKTFEETMKMVERWKSEANAYRLLRDKRVKTWEDPSYIDVSPQHCISIKPVTIIVFDGGMIAEDGLFVATLPTCRKVNEDAETKQSFLNARFDDTTDPELIALVADRLVSREEIARVCIEKSWNPSGFCVLLDKIGLIQNNFA